MTPSRATRIDVIAGTVVTVIGAASLYQSSDLDTGTLRSFGPGMLPVILASALLFSGLAILAVGLLRGERGAEHFSAPWRGPALIGLSILLFALTIAGSELGPLQIPRLGLVVVGPLTVILAGYGSGEANLRDLAAAGFGLTGFCLALFNDALGMDMPVVPGVIAAALGDSLGGDTILRGAYVLCAAITALLVSYRPTPYDA